MSKKKTHDPDAFRREFLNRTLPFLTPEGDAALKEKTVAVAGCGGSGGISAVSLARCGVERFHLADPGEFDLPDMNRQLGATTKTLGQNKAEVYRQMILDINPGAKVSIWPQGIQKKNIEEFMSGTDVLVDCLDLAVPPQLRQLMFERARQAKIYAFSGPMIGGFGTFFVGSAPDGMPMDAMVKLLKTSQGQGKMPESLYRVFLPEHLDIVSEWMNEEVNKVPSLCVGPTVSSQLMVIEVLNALIGHLMPGGRRPITLPQIVLLDLFTLKLMVINAEVILSKLKTDKS